MKDEKINEIFSNHYPRYQYSIFLKNGKDEQMVIRADSFEELVESKKNIDKILEKREPAQSSSQKCSMCGKDMVKRDGKYGAFWGCSGYPDCTNIVR